jgi:predicted dehydrogenase
VCDLDPDRAAEIALPVGARATTSLTDVLADTSVHAVVVATPVGTHRDLVAECVKGDRHVLVEKPLAGSVDDARALAELPRERGVTVMCDHTYRFAPAVRTVRELLAAHAPGAFPSVESIRTNHHHVQPDVDVFWDLAQHDLSILTFVLPTRASRSGSSWRSSSPPSPRPAPHRVVPPRRSAC